jgi:signal transduction histidine kinase/CheY-like chemotaxis protein
MWQGGGFSTRTRVATAALAGGLVTVVAVFGAIVRLDANADRQRRGELLVANVQVGLVAAQNIPWDADRVSGVAPAPLVRRDLHTTEKSIRNQLLALGRIAPKPATTRMLALHRRNAALLERQLAQVAAGRNGAAQQVSNRALTVLSKLQRELRLQADAFSRTADRTRRRSIAGAAALLFGLYAAFAIAVLVLVRTQRQSAATTETLQHAQKMEAVGTLAAGVAHDFNNVLTGLLGHAELASERAQDDRLRSYLDEVVRAGRRGQALTAQLLAFARRGDEAAAVGPLDLSRIVVETEPMLRRLLSAEIELELDLDPSPPATTMNRTSLEQVLVNLVSNAADAMEGTPGTLTISTSADRGRVVLQVSDTGVGMDDATRARIFEPYFTTKPIGRGTGIGLANVFATVRESGGDISVMTKLGVGTTFRLSFPAAGAPAEAGSPAGALPPPPAGGRGTILVLDDEPAVRALLENVLEARGYTTIVAANGTDGLRIGTARIGEIDLLLTDYRMPGMNGHDLATALTALRPDLKVISMSGYRDNAILPPGAHGLEKPFTLSDLYALVDLLLGEGDEENAA